MKLLLVALAGPALGCAAPEPTPDAAADTVRLLVARYDSAWVAKDAATVERLLAPDYLYFTSTGRLSRRDDALRSLADTGYVLTAARRSDLEITVTGAVARVVSRWEGVGRYRGAPLRDDQTCGLTWIRDSSRWRLLSEHCANRPPADSSAPPSG